MRFGRLPLFSIAATLTLAGCSDNTGAGGLLVVASIEISPPGLGLVAGATAQLVATPKTSTGVPVPDRPVTWSTNAASIANVSSTGLVTAVSEGQATITARIGDVQGQAVVTVSPKPVAQVTVQPPQATLVVGEAVQLAATPRDEQGQPLQGRVVSWESDNPAVASVSVTGLVVGVTPGTTTVRAVSEGIIGTVPVTVNPRPASRLGFTTHPANGTAGLPLGPVRVAVQDNIGGTVPGATTAVSIALDNNPGGSTLLGTLTVNAVNGVATFSDLVLNRVGAGYTLRATGAPLAPAISNPFAITAGAAAGLSMATQPGATATSGVPLAPQPVVRVVDGSGNPVLAGGVQVTVALEGAGAALGGTLTATTNAQGLATFAGLTITGSAGAYTLRFTAPNLAAVSSSPITLTAGSAAKLAVTTQPGAAAQSGALLAPQPVVQLQDADGNPVPQAGVVVTASVVVPSPSGPSALAASAVSLAGTVAVTTNAQGQAVFTDLAIVGTIGNYALTFSAPGLTGVASDPVSVGAGSAAGLLVVTQPSGTATNGAPFAQQPAVQLVDGGGNPVAQAGVVVSVSLTTAGAALGGTLTATTDATGLATFTDLSITGPAGSYTLRFSSPGLTDVESSIVQITAGGAAALVIVVQPAGAASGVPLTQQPVIQLTDQSGNAVTTSGISVTAALASGGGTLTGTLTVATNGLGRAVFTDLTITGPSGVYTIQFSSAGFTPVTSTTIGLGAGVATQLAIITQPSVAAPSGTPFAQQPVIQLLDASNNPVPEAGRAVTAAIASGGGALGGTVTVQTDANGVATFTDLSITGLIGDRTLQFTSPTLTPVTSATITITPGAAAQVAVVTQPSATVRNDQAFTTQPVVQLRDAAGNDVALDAQVITAAIASGGGTLGGTLTATTNPSGTATFADLKITGTIGIRTLSFSTGALTPGVSGNVTVTAGTATQIAIVTQPPPSVASGATLVPNPVVDLRDVSNNDVDSAGVSITVELASGNPTLAGTLTRVTGANGQATFNDLTITGVTGNRTLRFTGTGLAPIVSTTINVASGNATKLTITTPPSGTAQSGVALVQQPAIQLRDLNDNPVADEGVLVTAAIATSPGGTPSLQNATALTDANGLATFSGLAITGLIGNYTLEFSSGALATATSGNILLSAGAATQLVLTTNVPANGTNGVALSPAPVVQLRDAAGNNVDPATEQAITATINSGPGGTVGGTTVVVTAAGQATFSNLVITGPTGNYTLKFAGFGFEVVSSSVALGAGAATKLGITTQPSATVQNTVTFPQQPVIQLLDQSDNPVLEAGRTVTASIESGGGTLGVTTSVLTDVSGVATFTDLAITGTIGVRKLLFASSGLVSVSSGDIDVTAGPATAIASNSATSQSTVAGQPVAEPPSVVVTDANGNLVSGYSVTFTVTAGGGSTVPASPAGVQTNASGVATLTSWTVGAAAGTNNNSVSATGAGLTGSPVVFTSSVTAAAATTIAANSVTSQSATVATAVGAPPSALVTDGFGNPVSGVNVTFTVTAGGGSTVPVSPAVIATNALGVATLTSWTLGTGAGIDNNAVTAAAAGLTGSPVTYTASGTAAAAANIAANSVTSQAANAGTAVVAPPSVLVTDTHGNPVAGTNVTFTVTLGGGTTSPASPAVIATDASGVATLTSWTLGNTAGTDNNTVTATAAGLTGSPVTFTASATVGPAAIIAANSTQSQSATVATAVGAPPSVLVTDAVGNPVAGVNVTFTVTAGGGTTVPASGGTVATDALGVATLTSWTLGTGAGTDNNAVQAAAAGLTGSPVTFLASGTADAATTIAANSTQSQSATVSTAVSAPPSVLVTDTHGNPVSGVNVTFTVTAGGGTTVPASGGTVATNASGIATLTSWTLGPSAGTDNNAVEASAAGLTGSPVTFLASGTAAAATTIAANSATSQSATVNTAVAAPPSVLVTDGVNPVAGVQVTFTVTAGGGTTVPASGGTVTTDANGIATLTSWTLGTGAGTDNNEVQATVTGLIGSPVVFAASGTAGAATNIAANSAISQSATVATAVTAPPSVLVTDTHGNPVSGVNVTFTVTAGGGSIVPASGGTVATDANGIATLTSWTLGTGAGTDNNAVEATAALTGSPVTFTASGTPGAAAQVVITTQPGTVAPTAATPLDPQGVVEIRDTHGNLVSTATDVITVELTIVSGAGTLSGTTTKAAVGGVADFSGNNLAISLAGTYRIKYSLSPAIFVESADIVIP